MPALLSTKGKVLYICHYHSEYIKIKKKGEINTPQVKTFTAVHVFQGIQYSQYSTLCCAINGHTITSHEVCAHYKMALYHSKAYTMHAVNASLAAEKNSHFTEE